MRDIVMTPEEYKAMKNNKKLKFRGRKKRRKK
jgi:hypothetical protein